jgi:ubiquinone biosynthesis protein UbiJ
VTESRKPAAADLGAALLNHLLVQQSWAMVRLRQHAGRTFQLRLPLAPATLVIQADGSVAPAEAEAPPDATLTPNPLAWLAAANPTKRFIAAGDAALAQELADIFGRLRWDVEEDLSRVVGDIAAHRIVSTGDKVLAWHRNAAETIAKSRAEHWQEESPMLAPPAETRALADDITAVHARVDRLEQRIRQLDQTG